MSTAASSESGRITTDDVHCLVTTARVFGLPKMKQERGMGKQVRKVGQIIEKWDRLYGGKSNPPEMEHG